MTFDISQDYKMFDFLRTVEWYSATADATWPVGAKAIANCSFFDGVRDADFSGDDVRRTYASLIVRVPEWPAAFAATGPQRGDKFTLDGTTYFVESVDDDLVRLAAWRVKCYSTDSGV